MIYRLNSRTLADATGFGALLLLLFLPATAVPAQDGKHYPDGRGGEVFFPLGDRSFADEVVVFETGQPAANRDLESNPESTLGPPDQSITGASSYTALGCRGTLVVRFTDNALVDVDGPDLYIFEIGEAVERTFLAISRDGHQWTDVGRVSGGVAEVDIAAFVGGPEPYPYVRLIDAGRNCSPPTPGADINAIGAIGSGFTVRLSSAVLFAVGEAELQGAAEEVLRERVLSLFTSYPGARVIIEGHIDDTGGDDANQALSERRALAVQAFLESTAEVAGSEIASRGYGESRPVADNDSDDGRQRYRRVEITIVPAP